MIRTALAALLVLAACDDNDAIVFSPVFEGPTDDADANAFPAVDSIVLSIANEGEATDLVSALFTAGEPLELTGVPFGERLVMHAQGKRGDTNVAYGRTCAFTLSPDEPPPSPHLFFSRSGLFATTSVTTTARTNGRAIEFEGNAILVGGIGEQIEGDAINYDTPEMFDATTGTLSTLPRLSRRSGTVDALFGLSPPSILLVGGRTRPNVPSTFIEILDPPDGVGLIEDQHMARVGLSATPLPDGSVIVVGGATPGANDAVGTVTEVARDQGDVRIRDVLSLRLPRTGHTAIVLGDNIGAPVLIAGGTDRADASGNTVATAELYKPLQRTLADPGLFVAAMVHPRTQHEAVLLPDGSVLFIGGLDTNGQPVRTLELFTLEEGFTAAVDASRDPVELDDNVGVIDMSVTTLADGSVLVAGGRTDASSPGVTTAVRIKLDPLTGVVDVLPTDRLAYARAGHQAALLCDGTVLFTGGGSAIAERYNPNAEGRR